MSQSDRDMLFLAWRTFVASHQFAERLCPVGTSFEHSQTHLQRYPVYDELHPRLSTTIARA
jgi:hypothetical protein